MTRKTEINLDEIQKLASRGLTREQVAHNLGFTQRTWQNHNKIDNSLEEAYQKGKSTGIALIANALFEKAKQGNTTAQIFFLKCNGWKEAQEVTIKKEDVEKDIKDLSYSELIALAGEDKKKTTKEKIENE